MEQENKKPFCEFCDSKGVKHKKECDRPLGRAIPKCDRPPGRAIPIGVIVKDGVSKQEFDEFKNEVKENTNKILDVLQEMSGTSKIEKVDENEKQVGEFNEETLRKYGSPIPVEYIEIFDKYFDAVDGFVGRWELPKSNTSGNIMFHVLVPEKFSTMTDAHRKFYKIDVRSSAVEPHNIGPGIEKRCKLICQELRYNKKYRFKS